MLISAVQKFTMLDYPNRTACVVFTPGCNFRCGYCHNPEFVLPEKIKELRGTFIPEATFFNFLEERYGLLDGVVVTGGEPTLMPDLLDFLGKIKSLGFLVKLDTNGNRPSVIKEAVERKVVDYIAMDVKTSLAEYPNLVGKLVDPIKIKESIAFLKYDKVDYEFRSTLIKEVHPPAVLSDMAELIRGAPILFLQFFRSGNTLSPVFERYNPFSSEEMMAIAEMFSTAVKEVSVR